MVELNASTGFCRELVQRFHADRKGLLPKKIWDEALRVMLQNDLNLIMTSQSSIEDHLILTQLTEGRGNSKLTTCDEIHFNFPAEPTNEKPQATFFLNEENDADEKFWCIKTNCDGLDKFPQYVSSSNSRIDIKGGVKREELVRKFRKLQTPSRVCLIRDNHFFLHSIKDMKLSLHDLISGLITEPEYLEEVVIIGRNTTDKNTMISKKDLDWIRQELIEHLDLELGFKGNLMCCLAKKKRKSQKGSWHDRHVYTSYYQMVFSDSLIHYNKGKLSLSDNSTVTASPFASRTKMPDLRRMLGNCLSVLDDNEIAVGETFIAKMWG